MADQPHTVMSWQLRIPYRDRDEALDAESIWRLPKLLDSDEDVRVTRELLALGCRAGAKTVGQVLDVVEVSTLTTAGSTSTRAESRPG